MHNPVHVHLSSFQVISRDGKAVDPSAIGWKDTIDPFSGEHVDVAIRFIGHRGRYLIRCHNLEHEDMGMMAALEVT